MFCRATPKRFWTFETDGRVPFFRGTDEYGRKTIGVNLPKVKALVWAYRTCYCPICATERSMTRAEDIMRSLGLDPWDGENAVIFDEICAFDAENRRAILKPAKKPKPDVKATRSVGFAYMPGHVEPGVSLRKALMGYDRAGDYEVMEEDHIKNNDEEAEFPTILTGNLILSKDRKTKRHLPIIDVDYSHRYVPSATPGHGHLYLNRPISRWRWYVLMTGLKIGRVIEPGNFWWSLRRGENCTRSEPLVETLTRTKTVELEGLGLTTQISVEGQDDLLVLISDTKSGNGWLWSLYDFVENDQGFREWRTVKQGTVTSKEAAISVGKTVVTDYAATTRAAL